MSGGDKIYAEKAAQRLLATRRFLPGETMSPAFFDGDTMVWGTAVPIDREWYSWEERWEATVTALRYVTVSICKRQDEIDKKEYAGDEQLRLLRARAIAIGHVRIELNMERVAQERAGFTLTFHDDGADATRYLQAWLRICQRGKLLDQTT